MKILSIQQPWAWLIVNGMKDIENRDWPTRYRGLVLIHTGKHKNVDDYLDAVDTVRHIDTNIRIPPSYQLPRGGYVGVTEIVDCVEESDSPWFFGKYGFVLRNSKPIEFIEAKGSLGLRDVVKGSIEEIILCRNSQ